MSDNNGIQLTVQEAVSNEDFRHNIAILPWRVIDRLNLSSGDVIEVESLNKTFAIAYPDQRTGYLHIDGNTWCAAGVGIGETVMIRNTSKKDTRTVQLQFTHGCSAIEADAGMQQARGR